MIHLLPNALSGAAPPGRRGITLVEVMIVLTILVVAAGLFSRMVVATAALRGVNRENGIAAEAARRVLEEMRNVPFDEVFVRYDSDPANDPDGVGTAPGNLFRVEGLGLDPSSATGFHGEILMPELPPETPSLLVGTRWEYAEDPDAEPNVTAELREDVQSEELGMPRDLNGDSILDSEDHSKDYILLPVRVRIEWRGRGGSRSFEIHSMLTDLVE